METVAETKDSQAKAPAPNRANNNSHRVEASRLPLRLCEIPNQKKKCQSRSDSPWN